MSGNNFKADFEIFASGKLKVKEDLFKVIDICETRPGLLDKISFSAKYIQGLYKIIEKAAGNTDINNMEELKTKLTDEMKNFREVLIVSLANTEHAGYFNLNYFEYTPEAFANFRRLISDLEWVKLFKNDLKHS